MTPNLDDYLLKTFPGDSLKLHYRAWPNGVIYINAWSWLEDFQYIGDDVGSREFFVVSLWLLVLMDETVHAHFRKEYAKYFEISRSPKYGRLRYCGHCASGAHGHFGNPSGLVLTVNHHLDQDQLAATLEQAARLLVRQIQGYVVRRIPALSAPRVLDAMLADPCVVAGHGSLFNPFLDELNRRRASLPSATNANPSHFEG